MRCVKARRWLQAAVEGGLSLRRREALAGHVADCAGCREELRRSEALARALAAMALAAPLPPGLEAATLRRVRQAAAAEAERADRRGGWLRWLGISVPALAAAAVLVLVIGLDRRPTPSAGGRAGAAPAFAAPGIGVAAPAISEGRVAAPAAKVGPAVRTARAREAAEPAQTARVEGDGADPDTATAAGGLDPRTPRGEAGVRTADAARPELPPDLLARPDLFVDLPILKHMEKLQNFDSIETVGHDTGPQSNG